MNTLKEFDRNYLNLILEINKHIDGYIDAYIGPDQLQQEIDAQPPCSSIPPPPLSPRALP